MLINYPFTNKFSTKNCFRPEVLWATNFAFWFILHGSHLWLNSSLNWVINGNFPPQQHCIKHTLDPTLLVHPARSSLCTPTQCHHAICMSPDHPSSREHLGPFSSPPRNAALSTPAWSRSSSRLLLYYSYLYISFPLTPPPRVTGGDRVMFFHVLTARPPIDILFISPTDELCRRILYLLIFHRPFSGTTPLFRCRTFLFR